MMFGSKKWMKSKTEGNFEKVDDEGIVINGVNNKKYFHFENEMKMLSTNIK